MLNWGFLNSFLPVLAAKMRLLYVIRVKEFESSCCGLRFPNRFLLVVFTLLQLLVVIASFAQHVYSWWKWSHVFYCRSDIGSNAGFREHFLAYDLVIYDFGLMHRVLGTTECVANYLDGGYMRCSWCLQHATALGLLFVFLVRCGPRPIWFLWPALFMQSSYVLGMSILTMATTPKILEALGGVVDRELGSAFVIFLLGFLLNWLFTFVLWYYYWGVEGSASGRKHSQSEQTE